MVKGLRETSFDSLKKIFCHVIREEILFRIPMLIDVGAIPPKLGLFLKNILSQQYEGDVTIVPYTIALTDLLNIFTAPTSERVQSSVLRGERATWPFLAFIRSQTFIEMKLDKVLYSLKCKLLESSWMGIPRSVPRSQLPSSTANPRKSTDPELSPDSFCPTTTNCNTSCQDDPVTFLWQEEAAVPPLLTELNWRSLNSSSSKFGGHSYYPKSH